MDHRARQRKFAAAVQEAKADAFLLTHLANLRYLCGFTGSAGVLAYAKGRLTLFTDGRYNEQARQEVTGARVVISRKSALAAAAEWLAGARVRRVGVEAEHMTLAARASLGKPLKAALRPTSGLVERLRMIKDVSELQLIEGAVRLGSSLFDTVVKAIRPGASEASVAAELEYAARRGGAEGMSFDTIVAAGAHSALPHWRASSQPIPNTGFVVLDFGVILSGYCSDMTRTVWVGKSDQAANGLETSFIWVTCVLGGTATFKEPPA